MNHPNNSDPHNRQKALQSLLDRTPEGDVFCLPQGICSFSPQNSTVFSLSLSNSDAAPQLHAGLFLKNRKNLILDGGGTSLLCHGQMIALALLDCENITLQNFTIDWDIPLTAEGTVISSCNMYADVKVDPQKFPFHIEDGQLWFDGGDWSQKLHCWGHTEFDPKTDLLARNRGDRFPPTRQELLPDGTIRFRGDFTDKLPAPGNILVLRHGDRISPGILIHHCRNITLKHITIHASGGLGILGQFSDTLTFSHVSLVPNREKGRQFAGLHDDGIHLSADSGRITIENCSFLGLMDDPVNLHGIAVNLQRQPKGDIFCGKFMHPQSKGHRLWAEPGQQVAFLNPETMEELGRAAVKKFRLLDRKNFEISFEEPLDFLKSQSCSSFSLENTGSIADLICRHNHFGACRARGLLVTASGKVLIEDNRFDSPGAAIRIAGDVCTWYESGRCQDVLIQNNSFSDSCLSNSYQGGQGIISISPELPKPLSPIHRNIRIVNNQFCISNSKILYALCSENLVFSGNQIIKSPHYKGTYPPDSFYRLERCRDSAITDNSFSP